MKRCSNNSAYQSMGRYLTHISKYSRKFLSRELDGYGIGGHTCGYLIVLHHHGSMTEKELTDHMLVDKATTARALSNLEDQGYVERSRDPDDRRSFRFALTEDGKMTIPVIRKAMDVWLSIVTEGFTEEEREDLIDKLKRMEENLRGL